VFDLTSYLSHQKKGGVPVPWIYLLLAGICEVIWAVGLKYTHGFTKLVPSVITLGGMVVGFIFLSQALKSIPMGTAYAVWTGIGAVGTVVIGMIFLGEPHNLARMLFLGLIIIGILGLKMASH
jgi:quaternary ammonium compound-resistance protein SugE